MLNCRGAGFRRVRENGEVMKDTSAIKCVLVSVLLFAAIPAFAQEGPLSWDDALLGMHEICCEAAGGEIGLLSQNGCSGFDQEKKYECEKRMMSLFRYLAKIGYIE